MKGIKTYNIISGLVIAAMYGSIIVALAPSVVTEKFWQQPTSGLKNLPSCNYATGQVCGL